MYIDDRGVVLQCVKYDDRSFIAHLFTFSHGHVSFIVNNSRSKRSAGASRLFQPLSFLSFQWDSKPNTSLYRMKEVRLLFFLQDIPCNPIKRGVAMMLSEFMAHMLRNEAKNSDLYMYIEKSVCWFDAVGDGYANFHLVFLLKLLRFLGIAPNLESYQEGRLFDLSLGSFVFGGIPSELVMDSADACLLYRLANANYESMNSVAMHRFERTRMLKYVANYCAQHIPKFPVIQSLDILIGIFDD